MELDGWVPQKSFIYEKFLTVSLNFSVLENIYPASILYIYPATMAMQSCSIWTLVVITIERYFAICHPLNIDKRLTTGECSYWFINRIIGYDFNKRKMCEKSLAKKFQIKN